MSAAVVIAAARAAGVFLSIADDGCSLDWECVGEPPPGLLERIAAVKAEVLAELAGDHPFGAPDLEERAAIAEHDGSVPAGWAAALAEIERAPLPPAARAADWRNSLDAALRFADAHGAQAAAMGWTFADLFALDTKTPVDRTDGRGRALLLHGVRVVEITPEFIRVETPTGAMQRLWKAARRVQP